MKKTLLFATGMVLSSVVGIQTFAFEKVLFQQESNIELERGADTLMVNSLSMGHQFFGLMNQNLLKSSQPFELCSASDSVERRGCCSHHDGVCGCSGGRAVCCDGSFSPSCGCN